MTAKCQNCGKPCGCKPALEITFDADFIPDVPEVPDD